MDKIIYLDHAATTPMNPQVIDSMLPYFTNSFGNPSSLYDIASTSKKAISNSRALIAKTLGAKTQEIYFTSGGSESNNWAIKGIAEAYKKKGNHIITTKIEHHAILHTCKYLERHGFEVTYIDIDDMGMIKMDQLKMAIRPTTILISVMFANNEIGTLQPIKCYSSLYTPSNL